MQMSYCPNCGKQTGPKRAVGAGTVLGADDTGGFSLLATPFYPLRCIICGSDGTGQQQAGEYHVPYYYQEYHVPGSRGFWVTLLVIGVATVVLLRLGG